LKKLGIDPWPPVTTIIVNYQKMPYQKVI
jgi:hypothetical protein